MPLPNARPLPGGPLAIDLLNTSWRAEGRVVDWLADDAAVRWFSESRGCPVARSDVDRTRRALLEARHLVSRLLASPAGPPGSEGAWAEANAVLRSAAVRVSADTKGPALRITSDDAPWALAIEALVDAVELLQRSPDRIRECEHEDCVLWFVDTSKAGRRRWCSMERCGNRAKAKRHYARSTSAAP